MSCAGPCMHEVEWSLTVLRVVFVLLLSCARRHMAHGGTCAPALCLCSIAPHAAMTLVFLDALPQIEKAIGL